MESPTKEDLYKMYWEERISIPKIAHQLSSTYVAILKLFKKWNIPRRPRGSFNKKYYTPEEYRAAARESVRKYKSKPGVIQRVYSKAERKWQEKNIERCKEYNKKTQKKNWTRKRKFIDKVVLTLGCQYCGYKTHPSALEFHHLDPSTKKFSVRSAICRSIPTLKSEMRKCIILCANCHRELHFTGASKKNQNRIARFIDRVMLSCGCQRCGYKKCIAALEFHHRNAALKEFDLGSIPKDKIIEDVKREIRKCDILCANCHREVHWM